MVTRILDWLADNVFTSPQRAAFIPLVFGMVMLIVYSLGYGLTMYQAAGGISLVAFTFFVSVTATLTHAGRLLNKSTKTGKTAQEALDSWGETIHLVKESVEQTRTVAGLAGRLIEHLVTSGALKDNPEEIRWIAEAGDVLLQMSPLAETDTQTISAKLDDLIKTRESLKQELAEIKRGPKK